MGRRRFRRRKSSVVSDVIAICEKLPWKLSLLFTVVTFSLFYFVLPMYFENLADPERSRFAWVVIERRLHWFKIIGVCLALVGLYFTFRRFLFRNKAGKLEKLVVKSVSKSVGRDIS